MTKSLLALALGTLALGVCEYSMMGMLPEVARNLHVTIPVAGHFISAYALGVVTGSILLVLFARTMPLKRVLLGLAVMIALGNLLTALSPNYWAMIGMRFIAGLPHGGFFGVGTIVAERLAAKGRGAQAVAAMFSGITVANLFGVPLGTFVSQTLSWRVTYFTVAFLGLLVFLSVWKWVPQEKPLPDTGLKGEFAFLKKPAPWLVFAAITLGNCGVFCWYSFISPLMTRVSGFAPKSMTMLMLLAGFGMFVGNLASGKLTDKFHSYRVAAALQGGAFVLLVLIFFFSPYGWASALLMCLCTGCLFALSVPEQLMMIANAKGGQMLGASSAQVGFNLGNALGALFGGLPIEMGLDYRYPALFGTVFALVGFLLLLHYAKKYGATTKLEIE